MNTQQDIEQMLRICQDNPTTAQSAGRLLAKYEADVKRAFGSSGTVTGKVAMIDYHREQFGKGLALLVMIAGTPDPDQPEQLDQGGKAEQLDQGGKAEQLDQGDTEQLGRVIGTDGDRTIRELPPDIAANVERWKLDPPPGFEDLVEPPTLPPIPAAEDAPTLPPIPAAEDVPTLPPIPEHPTRRDHPARPSNKRRKPS